MAIAKEVVSKINIKLKNKYYFDSLNPLKNCLTFPVITTSVVSVLLPHRHTTPRSYPRPSPKSGAVHTLDLEPSQTGPNLISPNAHMSLFRVRSTRPHRVSWKDPSLCHRMIETVDANREPEALRSSGSSCHYCNMTGIGCVASCRGRRLCSVITGWEER